MDNTQRKKEKQDKTAQQRNVTHTHDTFHSTNPLHTHHTHTTFHASPNRTGRFIKWPFWLPTSCLYLRLRLRVSSHLILATSFHPSVIVLITTFPSEVSHECPARGPAWYTSPQACFTREKSDRSRATEFCEKGGKGMFGLPPSPSKISCQIPPTNHSFVPSLSFPFFVAHTNNNKY